MTLTQTVKLSNCISPNFYTLHHCIKTFEFTQFWLSGGRGSTKSSVASIEIVKGVMSDEHANAIVLRKVGNTLRTSVFEQIEWAINKLKVAFLWKRSLSPLCWTYKPTGQQIRFAGCDDASKLKSIKFSKGRAMFVWFEEVDEFESYQEVQKVILSLVRTNVEDDDIKFMGLTEEEKIELAQKENPFIVFFTFNPPNMPNNWANVECKIKRKDRMHHHSTYLEVPKHWLTKAFFDEAEETKKRNVKEYNHTFLGEVTGIDGLAYPMFDIATHVVDGKDFKFKPYELVSYIVVGGDIGTINDATTCNINLLTTAGRDIHLPTFYYDPTLTGHKPLSTSQQVELIECWLIKYLTKYKCLTNDKLIIVLDSAESGQDMALEFNKRGRFKAMPVPKKDRIADWHRLQNMLTAKVGDEPFITFVNEGYIDPVTFTKLGEYDMIIEEFNTLVVDAKKGEPMDGNDHCIDGQKYGSYIIYQGGIF